MSIACLLFTRRRKNVRRSIASAFQWSPVDGPPSRTLAGKLRGRAADTPCARRLFLRVGVFPQQKIA